MSNRVLEMIYKRVFIYSSMFTGTLVLTQPHFDNEFVISSDTFRNGLECIFIQEIVKNNF